MLPLEFASVTIVGLITRVMRLVAINALLTLEKLLSGILSPDEFTSDDDTPILLSKF